MRAPRAFATRRRAVRDAVRGLHPSYFALVMATGIVSVGLHDPAPGLSTALMWLASAAYLVLLVLYGWRATRFATRMRHDLADPGRAFGFFTLVAATNVLGTRLVLAHHLATTEVLLVVGALGWLILGYLIPWTAALGGAGRPVVAVADGSWFIWVVASQSVAVLSAAIEPTVGAGRRELALVAVCCWAIGVFLYAATGMLITARLLLYNVRPADLTPPYWVAMGACAITVVAGAQIARMAGAPVLSATRGLIADASVLFWAFGTWLIPALIAAGWWRHVVHRVPVGYDASWWSIVFPLGMYGVASGTLGETDHLPLVAAIGRGEIWVALAAWAASTAAMLPHLVRTLIADPRSGPPGTSPETAADLPQQRPDQPTDHAPTAPQPP